MSEALNLDSVDVKNVKRPSSTKVSLTVEFTKDQVSHHEKRIAQKIQREAKLPGFRPGKVPLSLVETKYRDKIRHDLVTELLELGLAHAIRQEKLVPISRPSISIKQDPASNGGSLEFDAEFEIQPEIGLKIYKGLELSSPKIEVTDQEVTEALDNLRERLAVLEPTISDTPAKGLFAVVEMAIQWEASNTKDPAKVFTVEVGEGKLLPELESGLMAMKVGEKKNIEAVFPQDYADSKLAGQKALFECNLLELKRKRLPELGDAFADQVKKGSTLLSLRGQIRQDIQSYKESQQESEQKNQAIQKLVKENPFDVPQTLVDQQAHRLRHRIEEDMKAQGQKEVNFDASQNETIRQRAEFQVRASMILNKVAEAENIQANENEVHKRITQLAQHIQQPVEKVRGELEKKGGIQQLRDEVLTDQVFDFLLKNAKIKTTT